MPRYFPVTRTVVEEVETSTGVDVANDDPLILAGEQVIELAVVEDYASMGDALDGPLLAEEDHYDETDALEAAGTADAEDAAGLADDGVPIIDADHDDTVGAGDQFSPIIEASDTEAIEASDTMEFTGTADAENSTALTERSGAALDVPGCCCGSPSLRRSILTWPTATASGTEKVG